MTMDFCFGFIIGGIAGAAFGVLVVASNRIDQLADDLQEAQTNIAELQKQLMRHNKRDLRRHILELRAMLRDIKDKIVDPPTSETPSQETSPPATDSTLQGITTLFSETMVPPPAIVVSEPSPPPPPARMMTGNGGFVTMSSLEKRRDAIAEREIDKIILFGRIEEMSLDEATKYVKDRQRYITVYKVNNDVLDATKGIDPFNAEEICVAIQDCNYDWKERKASPHAVVVKVLGSNSPGLTKSSGKNNPLF